MVGGDVLETGFSIQACEEAFAMWAASPVGVSEELLRPGHQRALLSLVTPVPGVLLWEICTSLTPVRGHMRAVK